MSSAPGSKNMISASEVFRRMSVEGADLPAVDVRSPGEYTEAHFLNTYNLPILNDEHRHVVGLTYKQQGSEQAQKLGHELVSGSYREQMIDGWCDALGKSSSPGLVFCWRGGLRSQLAQQWMIDAGCEVLRVEGGYKALREQVLGLLKAPKELVVLGGETGSGKTELLKQTANHIDLEGLANHRGSAFGLRLRETQPTQASFENALGQALIKKQGVVLVEDESRLIGRRFLSNEFYDQMAVAPMVLLKVDRNLRAQHIFEEYILGQEQVAESKNEGSSELHDHFKTCVGKIRPKLGGVRADQCLKLMNIGFAESSRSAHLEWIELLLETYYDKLYAYSLSKKSRKTLHEGDRQSCLEFLNSADRKQL